MQSQTPQHPFRWHLGTFVLALALAVGLAWLTGVNLGLFLGGLALCTILVPYAAVVWDAPRPMLVAAGCVAGATSAIWLSAVLADATHAVHLHGLLGACSVVTAFALFEACAVALFRRMGLGCASASGLTVVIALFWLMAPIWIFPHLQSAGLLPWMQRLIYIHPVFAINSAVPTSIWPEAPIAYTILNLNQDIAYSMPASPLAALLFHGVISLALCLIWIKEPSRAAL